MKIKDVPVGYVVLIKKKKFLVVDRKPEFVKVAKLPLSVTTLGQVFCYCAFPLADVTPLGVWVS